MCLVATAATAHVLTCRNDLKWGVLFHSGIKDAGYTRVVLSVKSYWNVRLKDVRKAGFTIATGIPYLEGMRGNGFLCFFFIRISSKEKSSPKIFLCSMEKSSPVSLTVQYTPPSSTETLFPISQKRCFRNLRSDKIKKSIYSKII